MDPLIGFSRKQGHAAKLENCRPSAVLRRQETLKRAIHAFPRGSKDCEYIASHQVSDTMVARLLFLCRCPFFFSFPFSLSLNELKDIIEMIVARFSDQEERPSKERARLQKVASNKCTPTYLLESRPSDQKPSHIVTRACSIPRPIKEREKKKEKITTHSSPTTGCEGSFSIASLVSKRTRSGQGRMEVNRDPSLESGIKVF